MNKKRVISRSPLHERVSKENKNSMGSQENTVDKVIIRKVFKKINNKPRLAFWDHESAVILHYLKETRPNFSMSAETARLMRNAVKNEHPDIWQAVIRELREKKSRNI